MLETPNCFLRGCVHFEGTGFEGADIADDTEATERPVCKAFPDVIPNEISYGSDLHLEPVSGDGGVVFKEGKHDAGSIEEEE